MSQKTLFNKTALAVAVALVSTSAWSAGFQLNEFSSSGHWSDLSVIPQTLHFALLLRYVTIIE